MSILFPDVPDVPGVPPVLRKAGQLVNEVQTLLTQDSSDVQSDSSSQWGIYDDGDQQVIIPDSVVSIEDSKEEQISTFPVEEGGFQSYNKVETPYMVRLVMTKSGSLDDRVEFLAACRQLRGSTDLYTVLTPEEAFPNANVTKVSKMRGATSGVQLMTVELVIEEVRQSATAKFTQSTTQSPASADSVDGGSVQPTTSTAAQTPPGQPL